MNTHKNYCALSKLDKYSNYRNKIENKSDDNLGEFIYKNYDKMDDVEIKALAVKCLDINQAKSILLNYELENYKFTPKENMTLKEFSKKALYLLQRYQCKAGGFCIEDTVWAVYDNNCGYYDVKESELLFENTISIIDEHDLELCTYINNILKMLDSLSTNIKIKYKEYKKPKGKLIKLHIWATDLNVDCDTSESVGL